MLSNSEIYRWGFVTTIRNKADEELETFESYGTYAENESELLQKMKDYANRVWGSEVNVSIDNVERGTRV